MSQVKKPPDTLRCMKTSIKSIVKPDFDITILLDATTRTHKIVIHTYQFLRLWILNKYHKKLEIPTITTDLIRMTFKSLVKASQGPKPKGTNLKHYNEFNDFYENTYKKLNYENKIDGNNLSQILNYMSVDILTNIENNIKLNFISYLKRFVNSSFKTINKDIIDKLPSKERTNKRKELYKDLYEIKEDLLNNTLKSNSKYHDWINKHKTNIFPKEFKNSYEFDIQNNPQKYIKCMIYMCLEIENLGTKSFQFFPLRNDIILKYIPIDTKSLVELFVVKHKNKYLLDIENTKHELWSKYFKLDKKVFKQKNYKFDYRISTDCYGVSIQLIHNDSIQSQKDKKANMKTKRKESKILYKDMTQEEKEKHKEDKLKKKKDANENIKLVNKEKRDKEKLEFKKLTKEEKDKKIKEAIKIKETNNVNKYIEFPYLEQLNDTQIEDLKSNNWVTIDPGKRCLFYMKNKEGITFKYNNKTHMNRTKRIKYQRLIKNYKDKKGITLIENDLSNYNSKTCKYEDFINFITNKNKTNEILLEKYKDDYFRKYKWYSHINRKRAETDLVRDIKDKYGNTTLIMGDWSDKLSINKLKYISTPNLGMKRKLGEYFKIYNLDEFRTSCVNYKTEDKCKNLYLPDKKGTERKIHSILTYQTENNRMGCINRDENAVNNMIKLVKCYLENKSRPEKFRRDYKFPDEIKDSNPNLVNKKASNTVKPVKVQLHYQKKE